MFTKQNYLSNAELLVFLRLNRAFNTKRDSSLDMGICSGGTLDELSLMLTKTIIGGNEYLDYLYPKFVTSSDWLSEEDVKKGMKLALYKKEDVLEMAKMLWKAPKGIDANLEEEV